LTRAVQRGIRRTIGVAEQGKAPATADLIGQMVAMCPDSMIGRRDRARLACGFAGAFRRWWSRSGSPRSEPILGHSLRSGFLTSAAEAGVSVLKMVEVSRHKSVDSNLGGDLRFQRGLAGLRKS